MSFCRKCGRQLNEGETVCPQCGTPVDRPGPGYQGPAPGNRPVPPAAPPKKSGVSTLLVVVGVLGVMVIAMLALVALVDIPDNEPADVPEGGYDVTFSLKDVVITTDDDTLLNVMQDGKYYNPLTGHFDLPTPSDKAQISLEIEHAGEALVVPNYGHGTLSGGSSTPISNDNVCTIHISKDVRNFDFRIFLISCYEKDGGSMVHNGTIDIMHDSGVPVTSGISGQMHIDPEGCTETIDLNGDKKPYAASGQIIITVTPVPTP